MEPAVEPSEDSDSEVEEDDSKVRNWSDWSLDTSNVVDWRRRHASFYVLTWILISVYAEEESDDDMGEIDTSNIIESGRTRGKRIDYTKEVDTVPEGEDEDDDDFEEPQQ